VVAVLVGGGVGDHVLRRWVVGVVGRWHTGRAAGGPDSGLNSKSFAMRTAAAFLQKGFHVYLFAGFVPTPYVAHAVTHLGCAAGIMVTASHNPKEDNGYKVYWSNGAQIISPHVRSVPSVPNHDNGKCSANNLFPVRASPLFPAALY
jgi:phosphomannomutase